MNCNQPKFLDIDQQQHSESIPVNKTPNLVSIALKLQECLEHELSKPFRSNHQRGKQLKVLASACNLADATPSSIAVDSKITKSEVTKILDALEASNKIRRIRDNNDLRKITIVVQPRGKDDLKRSQTNLMNLPNNFMSSLTHDEKVELEKFLKTFPK